MASSVAAKILQEVPDLNLPQGGKKRQHAYSEADRSMPTCTVQA